MVRKPQLLHLLPLILHKGLNHLFNHSTDREVFEDSNLEEVGGVKEVDLEAETEWAYLDLLDVAAAGETAIEAVFLLRYQLFGEVGVDLPPALKELCFDLLRGLALVVSSVGHGAGGWLLEGCWVWFCLVQSALLIVFYATIAWSL